MVAAPVVADRREHLDQPASGVAGLDDLVHGAAAQCRGQPAGGRLVGSREPQHQLGPPLGVGLGGELSLVQDLDGGDGAHDVDGRTGPGQDRVGAQAARAHGDERSAEALAQHHGEARHDGRGVGVQELGAAAYDRLVLLLDAGQVAGHVDQEDQRDAVGVAPLHEASGLVTAGRVEAAGQAHRVVGDDADRPSGEPAQAGDDVGGPTRLQLDEGPLVQDGRDHGRHVVGQPVLPRDQRPRVGSGGATQVHDALSAEQVDQHAGAVQRVGVAGGDDVHDTAASVGDRSAQALGVDVLTGDLAHDVGAGDEHPPPRSEDDDVGEGGTVRRAAGRCPEHDRHLRHPAAGPDLGGEHPGHGVEPAGPLAQSGSAGVPDPDDGDALGDGLVGDGGDGPAAVGAERTALDGGVGGERQHLAGADPTAGHDDPVGVLEDGGVVEQHLQPVPGLGGGGVLARGGSEQAGQRVSTSETS